MRLIALIKDIREPLIHYGFGLLRRERCRIKRRINRVSNRGAIKNLRDQPARMEAIMNSVRPQIVFNSNVSVVPRLQRSGLRMKGTEGFEWE